MKAVCSISWSLRVVSRAGMEAVRCHTPGGACRGDWRRGLPVAQVWPEEKGARAEGRLESPPPGSLPWLRVLPRPQLLLVRKLSSKQVRGKRGRELRAQLRLSSACSTDPSQSWWAPPGPGLGRLCLLRVPLRLGLRESCCVVWFKAALPTREKTKALPGPRIPAGKRSFTLR